MTTTLAVGFDHANQRALAAYFAGSVARPIDLAVLFTKRRLAERLGVVLPDTIVFIEALGETSEIDHDDPNELYDACRTVAKEQGAKMYIIGRDAGDVTPENLAALAALWAHGEKRDYLPVRIGESK